MIKNIGMQGVFSFAMAVFIVAATANYAQAAPAEAIKLVVDGKDITELSGPIIENGRTLVPIRFVSEEIGGEVAWDGVNRTVSANRGDKDVFLWIGSNLVSYSGGTVFSLSDVAPKIINDRTYVPLRLISNAFGIGIEWDAGTRTVTVDSRKTSEVQPFFDVKITSRQSGDVLSGGTSIEISMPESELGEAKETELLLLDRDTARGFVVDRKMDPGAELFYLPRVEDKGKKVLVAAVYGENRKFIGGDAILVDIDVVPEVSLTGLEDFSVIKDRVDLGQKLNFLASHVKYELTKLGSEKVIVIDERDPQGVYSWTPMVDQNGLYAVKVVAYDSQGKAYESGSVNLTAAVERKLSLAGVSQGMTVDRPVTLMASRNFDVTETEYLVRDVGAGEERILAAIPYGGHTWFPGAGDSGEKELWVRVKDTAGRVHESDPVRVQVDGSSKILLKGIGPKQVLTEAAELSVLSNVALESVEYILTDAGTGRERTLASNAGLEEVFSFVPVEADAGQVRIRAEGIFEGNRISSESIALRIYLGPLHGPEAIVEKDEFQHFASVLAKDSQEKTGMSAALQTAQAILETGWGQSVPVDKYSGKFSNNLFGIKGTGTNGSVISNTWEVYNGVSFRVDASFRAYGKVEESWDDHKSLLLNADRYAAFREVMHDSTLGAWAIKRAGYATDPAYPMKLMRIIKTYDLQKLDEVGIGF